MSKIILHHFSAAAVQIKIKLKEKGRPRSRKKKDKYINIYKQKIINFMSNKFSAEKLIEDIMKKEET